MSFSTPIVHGGKEAAGADIVTTLVHLMNHSRRDSVRLDAATYLADRLWGKPMQTHLVSEDSETLARYAELPDAVLRALIEAAEREPAIEGEAKLLPDATEHKT